MKTESIVEPLESRISPATLVDAHTVTYLDLDFDLVTVKISKGAFTDPNVSTDNFTFTGIPAFGERLVFLDLSNDGTFDGATLTITARRTAGGGDGHVNVGFIDAGGIDLATVTVGGDLGRIVAGNPNTATAGLKKLAVQSMGQFGTSTQSGGNLATVITGPLGKLVVKGNLQEAAIDVVGGANGKIGSVSIGGSLLGGAAVDSGSIESSGPMGVVKIGGDLRGGTGNLSGRIHAVGKLGNVSIGGSLIGSGDSTVAVNTGAIESGNMGMVKIGGDLRGGPGDSSGIISAGAKLAGVTIGGSLVGGGGNSAGSISSGGAMGLVKIARDFKGGTGISTGKIISSDSLAGITIGGSIIGGSQVLSASILSATAMGPVKVAGDLRGGSSFDSGRVASNSSIASVTIGGSLVGGTEDRAGTIQAGGALGLVKIAGDLIGGSVIAPEILSDTGFIDAGRIARLFVGGSIVSGTQSGGGFLINSGAVRTAFDIGAITVKGSLIGNSTFAVHITATGQENLPANAKTDVAIKSLSVAGRVEFTDILAGYGLSASNADAQIGAVTIGGDWIASNLVAGVLSGGDGDFGTADDTVIGVSNDPAIRSRIASILIKGQALGTPATAGDHFGFVAQQIGSLKIDTASFGFTVAQDEVRSVGATNDLIAREDV